MLKKINTQLILTIYIIINILYLLISSYLWRYKITTLQNYSYGFYIFLIINIIFIIYLFIKKKYKKNNIDIFIILCIIFGIISTIFAYNIHDSIFGFKNRYEGLLQIIYYLTLLFLTTFVNKKYKKAIINTIIITGIVEAIYGILQIVDGFKFIQIVGKGFKDAKGMITNSNFYGTYILISLTYSLGLFIDEKSNKKIIYFILYCLFITSLLMSNALSSIVGLICVFIYIIIYMLINKTYLKTILAILSFIIILVCLTNFKMTDIMTDIIRTKNEITEIGTGNLDGHFGNDRMIVWKETIKEVPKHIFTGIGIDNFYYLFDGKPLTLYGFIQYDKAHNELLQILVTQGIFSLLSYIGLYGIIVIKGIKISFKDKKIYLILPVIGYLVQGFFNISVIEVAPLFYISLGLLFERNISEKTIENNDRY